MLLKNSNISKSEQKENPQAVLDVLNWYDTSTKETEDSKYMTINKTLGKEIMFSVMFLYLQSKHVSITYVLC